MHAEEAPQAINMQARLRSSGLCITRSWAQDITQVHLHQSVRMFLSFKRERRFAFVGACARQSTAVENANQK